MASDYKSQRLKGAGSWLSSLHHAQLVARRHLPAVEPKRQLRTYVLSGLRQITVKVFLSVMKNLADILRQQQNSPHPKHTPLDRHLSQEALHLKRARSTTYSAEIW